MHMGMQKQIDLASSASLSLCLLVIRKATIDGYIVSRTIPFFFVDL